MDCPSPREKISLLVDKLEQEVSFAVAGGQLNNEDEVINACKQLAEVLRDVRNNKQVPCHSGATKKIIKRRKKRIPKNRECKWCHTTETTEWRNKGTLCNACGLQYRAKQKLVKEEESKQKLSLSHILN